MPLDDEIQIKQSSLDFKMIIYSKLDIETCYLN